MTPPAHIRCVLTALWEEPGRWLPLNFLSQRRTWFSQRPGDVGTLVIPTRQMGKRELGEVKLPSPVCAAGQRQSRDLDSGRRVPASALVTALRV